jgi:hypothetical protein
MIGWETIPPSMQSSVIDSAIFLSSLTNVSTGQLCGLSIQPSIQSSTQTSTQSSTQPLAVASTNSQAQVATTPSGRALRRS